MVSARGWASPSEPVADGPGRLPVLLVVEDEVPNRALLRAVLSRSPNATIRRSRIVEAATLTEARARLAGDPPDVVLLDVRLPDGSGLDLARELHLRPSGDRPAILVLSASVLRMDRAAAEEAGADAFLAKPYDTAELIDVLAGLLAARGLVD